MKKNRIGEIFQGTFGPMRIIEDFLPKPEDLVFKNVNTKVTIELDASTISFFKQEAAKHQTSYQRMIRNLLRAYVSKERKQHI